MRVCFSLHVHCAQPLNASLFPRSAAKLRHRARQQSPARGEVSSAPAYRPALGAALHRRFQCPREGPTPPAKIGNDHLFALAETPPWGAVWYIAAVKIAGEDRHRSLVNGSGTSENLEMGAGLHPLGDEPWMTGQSVGSQPLSSAGLQAGWLSSS